MKFLSLVATSSALLASAGAESDSVVVDAVLSRIGSLEAIVEQQRTVLRAQQEEIASLHRIPSSRRAASQRRRLAVDTDSFAGLSIDTDNAGVVMGENADVAILRTNTSELTLSADVVVDGALYLAEVEQSINEMLAAAEQRLNTLELEQLPVAAIQFPEEGGHAYDVYTAASPFGSGSGNLTYVFDYPITARLGYGRMVRGVYTVPSDGRYFMTTELRITDDDDSSVEIEFQVNGAASVTPFEMWLPTTVLRRTGISAGLFDLKKGDTLSAKSDLAPVGVKGVSTVFKVADDRVAFSAYASGAGHTASASLMTAGDNTVTAMYPATLECDDGVFTAPHGGIYFFAVKVRVSDSTSGDMEIEFQKNGGTTEGGFEMWLHEGDASTRRAHMSMSLATLEAGDTYMAISDAGLSATTKVVFEAFEIADDMPAFKVYNDETFEYLTKFTAYGDGVATTTDFERGSDGAYEDGVYTVPEDGFYYFCMKIRVEDGVEDDMGIEWKINSADAAHNMVMWMHNGDASGRFSGLSTIAVQVVAGDEIKAVSNTDMDAGEEVTQWTFSGFRVS